MSSDRQEKGITIFESFVLCCSVHVTAVGFPPCKLWLVGAHTASCQPRPITDCISDRRGTHKDSPRKKCKNRKKKIYLL